jgi:short subunit dehydrogenase
VPKTSIITGSSRGLGRALAEAALAAGEKVAATARRVDDLQGLKDRYRDQVLLLPLDVTNETQAIEAVTSTIRTFGRLDVLVNNAGYGNVAPVEDTTLEEFRAQIETNLFGTIILTKAVLRYFRERGSGHITDWPRSLRCGKVGSGGFLRNFGEGSGPARRKGYHHRTGRLPNRFCWLFNHTTRRTSRVRKHGRRNRTFSAPL